MFIVWDTPVIVGWIFGFIVREREVTEGNCGVAGLSEKLSTHGWFVVPALIAAKEMLLVAVSPIDQEQFGTADVIKPVLIDATSVNAVVTAWLGVRLSVSVWPDTNTPPEMEGTAEITPVASTVNLIVWDGR
jgi:hypothetical protein